MVVRLLLVFIVALAIGASSTNDSADAVSVLIEHEGETAADLDEAQVTVGEVVLAADDRTIPRAVPGSSAPSPPSTQGVFRPPRAAFV